MNRRIPRPGAVLAWSRAALLCSTVLWSVSWSPRLDAAGFRFVIPTINARPGDKVKITVRGDHEESAQGFSFAARFPAAHLTIERVHIEDTILEALDCDFFEPKVNAAEGTIVVGALVDSTPPFEGQLIPNIGQPLDFFYIEATVSASASGDLKIQIEDGLSNPPIENLFSVQNRAVPVTERGEGVIHVQVEGEGGGAFVRGDFNMDSDIDLSDPISVLGFVFHGGGAPLCVVAADANDDERVDISDPIFLLNFLFNDGRPPPPPTFRTGPDPTPGLLHCTGALE
jgi:hypothetical protein